MIHALGQHFGDYRLVRLLGSGGFAEVYEAEHLHLPGVKVAIKLLKGSFTNQQIEDLRREALLVNALDHPHIVQLRTFSIERNIPYLVMSYAQGGALDKRYPRGTRLALPEILSYVRPVAQALHYAHQRRIVHRDLKPANLLLTQDGRVQVADFGIAVVVHSSNTRTVQEIAGTLVYMAPEHLRGLAGPASEQYALAIMVYQWLSGTLPFDGNGNLYVISQQQMNQQPPSLRERLPDLLPSVEYVVMKALNKNPEERFATIQEFAEALEQASRPPFVPAPGQRLGDYQLVCKLGEGGFAEVYGAEHVHLGTKAAIKLLKGTFTPAQVEALRQEARAIIQLDHPHIIRAYGFSIERDIPYLVMAYAPDGSLATRHAPGTPLPLETVREYVRQIASALQYAHSQNITHRDIKPENMLLSQDGRVQVADFGISVMAQATRTVQDIVGSWAYMAPEQFESRAGPASDQYALGIMVYQWLCGVAPFGGNGSIYALPHQHMSEPPPSLCKRLPSLSPRIEQVVMKALSKKSGERYPSVQAFALAFEEACTIPVAVATPPIKLREVKTPPVKPPDGKTPPVKPSDGKTPPVKPSDGKTPPVKSSEVKTPPAKPPEVKIPPVRTSDVKTPPVKPTGEAVSSAGKTLFTYKHPKGKINAVAWSPDGTKVASGSENGSIHLWKASTGEKVLTLGAHSAFVKVIAWAPDGRLLASGGNEKTLHLWDVTSGKLLSRYEGHNGSVHAVAWSVDGRRLASGGLDQGVLMWEPTSGTLLERMAGFVRVMAGAPDGRQSAASGGDKTVPVWMTASSKPMHPGHTKVVNAMAWSPNGRLLASGSNDKSVQLWEITSNKRVLCYEGHSKPVRAVVWSPDGKWIALGGDDRAVQVWEAASGKLVCSYEVNSVVYALAWLPNGRLLATASKDKIVRVWEISSRKFLLTYVEHSDPVYAVAWSPDGAWIASAGNEARVWKAQ